MSNKKANKQTNKDIFLLGQDKQIEPETLP